MIPRSLRVDNVNLPRIIEFSVAALVAFVILAGISLLSLRPTLREFRNDAGQEWKAFLSDIRHRNRMLPGLVEAIRGFESGHGKLSDKLLAARAISSTSTDPEQIIAAVNDMEALLIQVRKLALSRPGLMRYPPFAAHWRRVIMGTWKANLTRRSYNRTVRAYNHLLSVFPQNLAAAAFGFVPLQEYPSVPTVADKTAVP